MEQPTVTKRYDNIVIDSVNLFYKTWDRQTDKAEFISQKVIYKEAICRFIKSVETIKETYLHSDGKVWLLFDNYFSRSDLQSAFTYADRKELDEAYKATRKKENRPFYQSLNFIQYYYLIGPSKYGVVRIDGFEADDLVKPLLENGFAKGSCLFITSDLDWARYMSPDRDMLPSRKAPPFTMQQVAERLGFPITEASIIVYKSIFGDPADNIKEILPKSKQNIAAFIDLVPRLAEPNDLIAIMHKTAIKEMTPFLQELSKQETQYQINSQLVSTMACSQKAFEENVHMGSNSNVLFRTVREAIGLVPSSQAFTFSKIKRPRK